ncbi:TOTE conflict system archaeo-eukaryotic primase domain-containing protein [Bacteroides nordii]|uniref:TOTE conflict system archaeo-eukaryotic primase domain-containing protein n=1 Tax=Bacteroides nordii TaxID=291645 RepID=UPI002A831ED0|nr:DEAD/DEAH box helicase family protein [Bacteroides nordii]
MDKLPTYQELLAINRQLVAENEQLRKENAKLGELVKSIVEVGEETKSVETNSDSKDTKPVFQEKKLIVTSCLSLEEKVTLFSSLFKGREDVFAKRWYSKASGKSGYQPVCLNEWNRQFCNKKKYKCTQCPNRHFKNLEYEDIYKHLEGRDTDGCDVMGIYVVLNGNQCNFLCVDFDDKQCAHGYKNDVLVFVDVCKSWDIPCSIERSRSGNGAHVWIFFKEPLAAIKARKLGNAILTETMNRDGRVSLKSYDRVFPSQDYLPEGGLGNLVALPLQGKARKNGNSVFVDETFTPFEEQWAYLLNVEKVSEPFIDEVLALHGLSSELGELSTTSESKPWEAPVAQKITNEDFPKEVVCVKSDMLYVSLVGLSGKVLNHIKRIASFKNPEFYAKQGMRLSTYNILRIISCADILEEYVALPRGCEDVVVELLMNNRVHYRMKDETNLGKPISVKFKGELREEQDAAIASLMAHNTGVLNGTTAFGKTVTAIGLISKRKVNTLILVHTKALLEQWKSRLEEFLDIDYVEEHTSHKRGRKIAFSPFGTLDSNGNRLRGMVDIVLIQSCFDDKEVRPFVRDYGMVIVDECHHVSAVNFEHVLKRCNARYVYGLTATPIRKDGHQPIIFMQCGPIRYSADAKMQMASQTFERLLIPRFTSYRELVDDKTMYIQILQRMVDDDYRNRLIAADVCKVLDEGRSPIVLTSLTSHVVILSAMLADCCKNVITLIGSESVKEKRLKMEHLQNVPKEEALVIIATGKYVGEGFDCPRLDTLFLALPISWKGIVAQYAGRLHRNYPGKELVQVYDYIDIHVPMCDVMYKRRLKGYASVGYKIQQNDSKDLFGIGQGVIFNGKNYQNLFFADLSKASKSVIISATKLWFAKRAPILELLADLSARGVEVIVFTRQLLDKDKILLNSVQVNVKEKLSLHTAIIDKSIVWYGSVNYLGYNAEDDNAIKIADSFIAEEIIKILYE